MRLRREMLIFARVPNLRSSKIAKKKSHRRPLQITYWRTCNGYFYWRTFSRTLLVHQEHNASIWLVEIKWLGEYRPIIMKHFMLVSHGTNVWYQWLVTLPTIRWRMIHQTSHAFISISPNLSWPQNLNWYKDIYYYDTGI